MVLTGYFPDGFFGEYTTHSLALPRRDLSEIYVTITRQATLHLEWEVRTDAQEGLLTSRRHWRCDTIRVCCTGW